MTFSERVRGRGERGEITLIFVLVPPAVFGLILGAVYLGVWLHCRTVAPAAAQEGLAAARVESGGPAAGEARANR